MTQNASAFLGLAIYCLMAFGISFVLGFSHISLPVRVALAKAGNIGGWCVRLLECPGCLGFWVGAVAYIVLPWMPKYAALLTENKLVGLLVLAFFTVASNLILSLQFGLIHAGPKEKEE